MGVYFALRKLQIINLSEPFCVSSRVLHLLLFEGVVFHVTKLHGINLRQRSLKVFLRNDDFRSIMTFLSRVDGLRVTIPYDIVGTRCSGVSLSLVRGGRGRGALKGSFRYAVSDRVIANRFFEFAFRHG